MVRPIAATFLLKLSKHLALLVSFLIVGLASRSQETSELAIFLLAVVAALLHLTGRALHSLAWRAYVLRHSKR